MIIAVRFSMRLCKRQIFFSCTACFFPDYYSKVSNSNNNKKNIRI